MNSDDIARWSHQLRPARIVKIGPLRKGEEVMKVVVFNLLEAVVVRNHCGDLRYMGHPLLIEFKSTVTSCVTSAHKNMLKKSLITHL